MTSALAGLTLDGCQVSDLGLDFTLPGQPEVELCEDGANVDVTLENAGEYVQRVLDVMLCEGVRAQVKAFRTGFSSVFARPAGRLHPDELDVLLNGSPEKWEVHTIVEYLKFDHGYTRNSRASLPARGACEFDDATLAVFPAVTDSPRLLRSLARLTPRLTIVQKQPEDDVSPDAYLPSVMTCNYVKLPTTRARRSCASASSPPSTRAGGPSTS